MIVNANYKLHEKTARYANLCFVKTVVSADWLFTVHFVVNFQTKAEKPEGLVTNGSQLATD